MAIYISRLEMYCSKSKLFAASLKNALTLQLGLHNVLDHDR